MKKSIKLIAILALLAIGFTACHKDNDNDYVGTPHKARYEIVSLGEENVKLELYYTTQKGVGYGNGIITENEIATTPWQHEFTFYETCPINALVEINGSYNEIKPIKISLYIDDVLVAEQQNDEHNFIVFTYFY